MGELYYAYQYRNHGSGEFKKSGAENIGMVLAIYPCLMPSIQPDYPIHMTYAKICLTMLAIFPV